jgi:Transposase DDE domain group 1
MPSVSYSAVGHSRVGVDQPRASGSWTRQHQSGEPSLFKDNAARLQLFALSYNLRNFLRQLVLPKPIQGWTLRTLREKLVKIGAKVVSHAKYVVFQLAEIAVPRQVFAAIVERIGRLRLACASG